MSIRPGGSSTSRFSVVIFVFTLTDPVYGGKAQQAWRELLKKKARSLTRKYHLHTVQFKDMGFNEEGLEEQQVICTAYERTKGK